MNTSYKWGPWTCVYPSARYAQPSWVCNLICPHQDNSTAELNWIKRDVPHLQPSKWGITTQETWAYAISMFLWFFFYYLCFIYVSCNVQGQYPFILYINMYSNNFSLYFVTLIPSNAWGLCNHVCPPYLGPFLVCQVHGSGHASLWTLGTVSQIFKFQKLLGYFICYWAICAYWSSLENLNYVEWLKNMLILICTKTQCCIKL